MKILKNLLIALVFTFSFAYSVVPVAFGATTETPLDPFCNEVSSGRDIPICEINKQSADTSAKRGLLEENGIFRKILWVISWITGLLAGVFIIVGGIKLATSGGNADSVKSARNMVLYSCVGIAVVALSNVIINFVLSIVAKTNG